jgi:capsular polysaccharide biosynthesis protein
VIGKTPGTTGLVIDDLVCAPVLASGVFRQGPHDVRGLFRSQRALQWGSVSDALYIPELRLQLVGGTLVPQEAIAEPWALGFEKGRQFQGKAGKYAGSFEVTRLERDVCVLANFYSRNFYHWLTEEMPKALILERAGWDGSYVIHALPAFAREFLLMLGIQADRLITELPGPTVFKTASFTTSVHGWNLFEHEAVFNALREALLDASGAASGPRRRLWLDRRLGVNNAGRDLENPQEVNEVLARYGVETVDIAALPVREQVSTAASCELLSGVHGAGFVHAMFMPPRSPVVECFAPLFINPGIFDICRILRHRHHMVVYEHAYGGYPYGKLVKVSPVQLDLVLRSIFD